MDGWMDGWMDSGASSLPGKISAGSLPTLDVTVEST